MKEDNTVVIRKLDRIEKALKGNNGPQELWLKANAFMKKTRWSKEQLRGLRQRYCMPSDRMVKPRHRSSTQYLYNLVAWQAIYGNSDYINGLDITHAS